MRKVS